MSLKHCESYELRSFHMGTNIKNNNKTHLYSEIQKKNQNNILVPRANLCACAYAYIASGWFLLQQGSCLPHGLHGILYRYNTITFTLKVCLKYCEECSTFHQNVFITWHWGCLWQAQGFFGCKGWGSEELYRVGRADSVAVLWSLFFSVIPDVNHPQMKWGCFGEYWYEPSRQSLGEKEQLNIALSQGSSTQVWFFSFYHCIRPWGFTAKQFFRLTLLKTKGHCEKNLL